MLQNLSNQLSAFGGDTAWIAQVFALVFVALLCDLLLRVALRRLRRKVETTANPWDDALVVALQGPATLLVWMVGLTLAVEFAVEAIYAAARASVFDVIAPLRQIGVVVALTWFLLRLTRRFQENIIERSDESDSAMDATTVDAIGKLLRASILITAALVMLQTLGFSISGILAFGGIGGIAIGFAARDLLANFFGGLMLYLDRPFAVGDWVRSPDREIEGTVEDIGWRLTRIRSFDMRPIYVPNGVFSTMAIVNPSRMTHRRIYETVGIRYRDVGKMATIVAEVKAMLQAHDGIDPEQTLVVSFTTFAASSLDFFVYAFTHATTLRDYSAVKQDVLLQISAIIESHGAEIAFPTKTLEVPDAVRIASATDSSNSN